MPEAVSAQHRLVDIICQVFSGQPLLDGADFGIRDGSGPTFTRAVEQVIARYFEAADAILVQGAGTGALREALAVALRPGGSVVCHLPGPYHTTGVTLESMGATLRLVDMNDLDAIAAGLSGADLALLQHAPQLPSDVYDLRQVIATIRASAPHLPIVVDDNYTPFKVPGIGIQLGADLSAFSMFKLLGPEGVGCVTGDSTMIRRIRDRNPSGGTVVQGPTARLALEGIVHAPVLLAIQDSVAETVASRLNAGEVPGVVRAQVGNLAETDILIELANPIAEAVVACAPKFGAANFPVGAESVHELVPLIYKPSKLMLKLDHSLGTRLLRVNPLRAGPDTVVRLIYACIQEAEARNLSHPDQAES